MPFKKRSYLKIKTKHFYNMQRHYNKRAVYIYLFIHLFEKYIQLPKHYFAKDF